MSAFGTLRTCATALQMSAIGGKADMNGLHCKCLLLTQSGHSAVFKKGFCDIIGTGTTETCEKPVIL